MTILLFIGGAILLGLLIGCIGNAKAKAQITQEYKEIEKRDNMLKTKPPYKIGDLYYHDHHNMGMVVSTNGRTGRYVGFSFYYEDMETKIQKAHLILPKDYSDVSIKTALSLNAGNYCSLPSKDELERFGRYYERFMELGFQYNPIFKDFRNDEYSNIILSRTLTNDARSIYVYDLKQRKSYTISISENWTNYIGELLVYNFD